MVVHTLAFAEISESVVLKHNTEQKKKTQHIIPVSWNDAQPTGKYFVRMMFSQRKYSVGCELF